MSAYPYYVTWQDAGDPQRRFAQGCEDIIDTSFVAMREHHDHGRVDVQIRPSVVVAALLSELS